MYDLAVVSSSYITDRLKHGGSEAAITSTLNHHSASQITSHKAYKNASIQLPKYKIKYPSSGCLPSIEIR